MVELITQYQNPIKEILMVDFMNPRNNNNLIRTTLRVSGLSKDDGWAELPTPLVRDGHVTPVLATAIVAASLRAGYREYQMLSNAMVDLSIRPVDDEESIMVYDKLITHEQGRHVGDEPGKDKLYVVYKCTAKEHRRIAYIAVCGDNKPCFVLTL